MATRAHKARFDFNQYADRNVIDELGQRMLLTPKGYTQTAEGQAGSLANILGGAITGYKIGGSLLQPAPVATT